VLFLQNKRSVKRRHHAKGDDPQAVWRNDRKGKMRPAFLRCSRA
jgi:hypothetical protein